ncbi:undecaprenyldiphospho-muramoylpentapeptide beta-N-acetylglucosaminyltransferase [Chryseobacterium indologenes]|uniref:UDP-N-acetylglucosamine--N-acetylmuramyl-(pentapeptide) pyrophosphoryl-undecaprenol N-acetylglucosamine transferase n=2 Tax=Chryseobacterium indologenes TaxID=253 RepID=A0AAD0YXQ0_CHRID|nr:MULTISPECIES: undecaprenyldiphospho-muramoylpentapeptide beta-N-acetylglucosaminyltransferase [Chryseobacterium]ASE63197.1 undecaprenyldiphospho-muramoylpentapeptide beta-N-acetylglucosaminyltransferase [Chryseobacterium indologenes]AYZ37892.1 undecaprenyldiphospho-muramoylpentapeptide beta-N-acetylglucosaminyltransferase [Chryseobacterium indologenes]AZB18906.1 undecaprenyldiphospho-muramoylpentapeptide beta-N-acetylglucosaminyltransferase [Chryseobacterium indologenes]MBF6646805.1 undecapr
MNKKLKIILSGGGTGGHIFPAIAIADEIKKRFPDAEFLFIGANGKMEMEKVPQAGYKIEGIDIAGIDRGNMLSNLGLPFKILKSLSRSKKIIKNFAPDFAVGTGGFASGPALYEASKLGIPIFIQEQNAHAGVTNKILSKKARAVFTAYPQVEGFPAEKIKFLGNPIRSTIVSGMQETAAAKEKMGLNKDKLTILSVGGSLGSRTLNNAWKSHLNEIVNKDYQLIWQTGKLDYKDILEETKGVDTKNIQILEFIKDMELAYSAADVIVSRAGAIAISELAVAQKPVLLVPFPFAAEDHQTKNAMNLVDKNAARMVKDSETQEKFWNTLSEICENENIRKEMSANLRYFAKPDAAKEIVDEIFKLM